MPVLGVDNATRQQVLLTPQARRQGVYVIGTTGTGKTTLLQNLAYQDMEADEGLCVLDPHGDLIDELLLRVPHKRLSDVILFAPGDPDQREYPCGLNLLECDRRDDQQKDRVTSTVISTLYKLFSYSWGPRMEDLLRFSVLTLMESPDTTLLDLLLLLASPKHRARYTAHLEDPVLRHFWEVQFASYDKRMRAEVVGSSLNKIGRFLANRLMRNIVAQPRGAFNLRQIMDEGKILLVNLSKGDLGEDNSALLGAVLVNQVLIAALQRREVPQAQRRPFHLIVDEYQSFATQSFPTLQSEARKYGIDVVVAHQYRDQLDDLNKGSTLNVANFIDFRVSGIDSFELASQFDCRPPPPEIRKEPVYKPHSVSDQGEPHYVSRQLASGAGTLYHDVAQPPRLYSDVQAEKANELATLRNHQALCRLIGEQGLVEYAISTPRPYGTENPQYSQYIREQSVKRCTPRKKVEQRIKTLIGEQLDFDEIADFEELG